MALTAKKRYPNTTARRKLVSPGTQAQRPQQTPITITGVAFVSSTATVTLDQPVILAGIPAFPSQSSALPVSAVLTAPNVVSLTYGASVTALSVPFQDPAIRNGGGGYVTPGSFSD